MSKREDRERLRMWQGRLTRAESSFSAETAKMDAREKQYLGSRELKTLTFGDLKPETPHVRNLSAELIEAQVSSAIPQPKVTARRKKDEHLAKLIEDMLRDELDRLPFERMNDQQERTVPIQGAGGWHVEWDPTQRTHTTAGELNVTVRHPKQLVPQDGLDDLREMDYFFLRIPQTKEGLEQRYGVDLENEGESEPDVKGTAATVSDEMVTQYIAYYKNGKGGVGLFSWVNDTVLEDLEDYQARRLRHCAKCGAREPAPGELESIAPTPDGTWPPALGPAAPAEDVRSRRKKGVCPYCGGTKWEESEEDLEELRVPVYRSDGTAVGGMTEAIGPALDSMGMPMLTGIQEPVRVPYYKPDVFPVVWQKNVSVFGRFMGDSDLDKIADQQNTVNRIEAKIIDKLVRSGSYMTLPPTASIEVNGEEGKVIRLTNAADKALIGTYDMEGSVSQDMAYLAQTYEEARQVIGVTDSFQGRKDTTATSGKAKEFAAAQSAGRLESKRIMKNAAYAELFEIMFKFILAYADEPRPVVSRDIYGNTEFREFNKWDFLEQDAAGEWYWNDQFLFSCDSSAPLAANREAMWQETLGYFQQGAFGDPTELSTLIYFWTKMELLHYPGAGETKASLEQELQKQQEQAQMQQQAAPAQGGGMPPGGIDQETAQSIDERARQDALAAVMGRKGAR